MVGYFTFDVERNAAKSVFEVYINTKKNVFGRLILIGLFLILANATQLLAQSLAAYDDYASTGPVQTVKANVLINDIVPCGNSYVLTIKTPPNPSKGTATVSGYYIVFKPALGFLADTVNIEYEVACGASTATATLEVMVTPFNAPVNVIPQDAPCADEMDRDIPFGIKRKYSTLGGFGGTVGNPSGGGTHCIDVFTSPLVADLNGDGKPEIIALGVNGGYGGTARADARYINIYNGQTGARMFQLDFGTYSQSDNDGYHRAPSTLAVADMNGDGTAEIIYTRPDGAVIAYTPTFSGSTITALPIYWTATDRYKAPTYGTASTQSFSVPTPTIVDINGDGIPEVVVYNKVYNGQTGALLMAWQGAAPSPVNSTLAAGTGLQNRVSASPTTLTNANNIKAVAMLGRRNGNGTYADSFVATPAIWDIDGDGIQEIITGNRIHKIQINDLANHLLNTYTTIEGPVSVTLRENPSTTATTTHYLSDGYTRVADIDGDGFLDIIVTNVCDNGSLDTKILVYVWDPRFPATVKAALTYYSNGANGNYSIPFVGDINGKMDGGWDGTAYTKKLPEICILAGATQINRSTSNGGRSGIKFHPLSDDVLRTNAHPTSTNPNDWWDNNYGSGSSARPTRFNRTYSASTLAGHIIALTWDDTATDIEDKLKLSWGMEHTDRSHSTGITLFDFDNNGTKDLCYKDETTLRVVSPAKGNNGLGRDYVTYNETEATPGTSIMFRTPDTNNHPDAVFGGTGFEYPVIADVNMDGSADIVVTRGSNSQNISASSGFIMVFEYSGHKWAPAPPVWNQNLYNPLHIHEDLTVPANPQDMLRVYLDYNNDPITPYNGCWIQQPIVKEGMRYVPVVRKPDAVLTDMEVTVNSTTQTTVVLTILNLGTATIGEFDPISFYDGGIAGNPLASSTYIGTLPVGVDIFPQEMVTLTYILNSTTVPGYLGGYNFNNHLLWARILDDYPNPFPSVLFEDCDPSNNAMQGIDCPYLNVKITSSPDGYICGYTGTTTLSITDMSGAPFPYHNTPTFQWYKNNIPISGAVDSVLLVTEVGEYRCLVTDGICLKRTTPVEVTRDLDCYTPAYEQIISCISTTELDVLTKGNYACDRSNLTITIVQPPTRGTFSMSLDKNILYSPTDPDFIGMDSIKYQVDCSGVRIDNIVLHIRILPCIDNIVDADCYVTPPPPIVFGIDKLAQSATEVSLLTSPVCGDIDGDGEIEILVMNHTGSNTGQSSNAIYIYGFNKLTNSLYRKYTISGFPSHNYYPNSPIAIAKVDGRPYASIFFASYANRTLYKYDFNGTSWTPTWTRVYTTNTYYTLAAPAVADIMGNGRTQVIILDKVIDTRLGNIIANGGLIPASGMSSYSFGRFGHVGGAYLFESIPVVIDINDDGRQEVIGGDCVYGVNLVDFDNLVPGNTFTLRQRASTAGGLHPEIGDGGTAVADINNDGQLEVIVTGPDANNLNSTSGMLYVYNPLTGTVIHSNTVRNIPRDPGPSNGLGPSRPFVGDFDNDGFPEIALTGINTLRCYKYDTSTRQLNEFGRLGTSDTSGSTTLTVFNFAHDGKNRLVYRDETRLRIIDGSTNPPTDETWFDNVESPTVNEFPIIADVNGDGAAEIIVTGRNVAHASPTSWFFNGELRVYASNGERWAPARTVWNQAAYNSLNVNEDLTIPSHPISPATTFAGDDGILGTTDDVRPFNGFLMQQTLLDANGLPIWVLPDITPVPSLSSATLNSNLDSVVFTLTMTNQGDAPIGAPVHFSLYKDSISSGTFITNDSTGLIDKDITVTVTFKVAVSAIQPALKLIIRLNDRRFVFPVQTECDDTNNVIEFFSPALPLLMTKRAALNGVPHDGTLANPVSALYSDTIEYTITAFNGNFDVGTVIITDVLPAYLEYKSSIPPILSVPFGSSPPRDSLRWVITGVLPFTNTTVSFKATPQEGASASQPLYNNRAWITVSDTITVPTNYTYHQGAGISTVTFSASFGGSIHNASIQAVDYRTSPRSGIVIVPDEGYRFAGWSHADYISLRGETVKSQSGIMHYDTLTVYGDVTLRANFELERYPILYHLHGGVNAENNPSTYTISSETITLEAPEKSGDVFVGWVGSNGDEPEPRVTIPEGSTGELVFYASYLHSGHKEVEMTPAVEEEDRIWAVKNELCIRTSKSESIIRIYSLDGILQKQQVLLQAGETRIKLAQGVYIVALNNNLGKKIAIIEN